uniref:4-substituted benzoates-glutamate ligase GH3.12 n=1 Tax=Noccaea caerulescens TaxID=107243 RepID=A0A1J3HXX5_NOCCA
MMFISTRPLSATRSGLPVDPLMTSFVRSSYFKNWSSKRFTSPDEVILCVDNKQSMYCHLLSGLIQREEVVSMAATFASSLVQAITFLETHWKELCDNIRLVMLASGSLTLVARNLSPPY